MGHSNSSISTFTDCMAKYNHSYILHSKPCRPPSPHLTFGSMAHEVLYKAGCLRDEYYDGVVNTEQYYPIIPSELAYTDLQREFGITSWQKYFVPIIKRIAQYEKQVTDDMFEEFGERYAIQREIKLQMTVDELKELGINGLDNPIVGVIDFLLIGTTSAAILDYKFSTTKKTQDDFDMNSQLYLYAFFIHTKYDIPLHNIKVGYIDVPKMMFDAPKILSNGTISRDKNQNVLSELYKASVEAIHGKDEKFNCELGGWYYDAYCAMKMNDVAYLSVQYLDAEAYEYIVNDMINTSLLIDKMVREKIRFPAKHNAYTCGKCEYLDSCKPWTKVGG